MPSNQTKLRLLGLLGLTALTACSGTPNVQLAAQPQQIPAGGGDFALITATAMMGDDPAGQGIKVTFETTDGSFDAKTEVTYKEVSTDGGGQATVKLYSAASVGEATVTASFYDEPSGLTGESSITVKFTPPLPVDGTFRLTCDAVNIGALREPVPDIKVTCTISARTLNGKTIPGTALSPTFITEAGDVTAKLDSSGDQVYIYSPKGGASAPRDVDPDPSLAEPSYDDKNGKKRNPRDGLATIIAVVDGRESFTDSNGNGRYDQGEPFSDAAEPFVDHDDDDKRDSDEKYVDANNNGRWDVANGKWDARTKIMAIYKILWTGKLDNSPKTSRIDRLSSTIADGGKLELTAYALDANMNPVAAFQGNQDYLEWTLNSYSGDATSNDATTPTMDNTRGFSFDKSANTERKRWKLLSNSFTAAPFKFTVEDGYPKDTSPPSNFTVSVDVYVTPGPQGEGYYLSQLNEKITDKVQGTCD